LLLDQVFQFLDKTSYQKIEDPLPVKGDLVTTGLHVNINDFVITVALGKVTFAPFTPAMRMARIIKHREVIPYNTYARIP
jgi:hypothetical protein